MISGLLRGAAAGAAGTTALNATTYLDMVLRGRPSSNTPEQLVERVSGRAGVRIPGDEDTRRNRVSGLGPLAGIAVGTGVGALAGVVHQLLARRGRLLPTPVSAALIGAAAMAASDVPLAAFGVSDPRTWRPQDWAADVVPHLVYGLATHAVLRSTD